LRAIARGGATNPPRTPEELKQAIDKIGAKFGAECQLTIC